LSNYLTGSMASNYWGVPRSTHDLDFVIQLPMTVAARIVQEFSRDFYIDEEAARFWSSPSLAGPLKCIDVPVPAL
jgi:hypothetical protein